MYLPLSSSQVATITSSGTVLLRWMFLQSIRGAKPLTGASASHQANHRRGQNPREEVMYT